MILTKAIEVIVNSIVWVISGLGKMLENFFQMDMFSRVMILLMLGLSGMVIFIIFAKRNYDKERKEGKHYKKVKMKMAY